MQDIHQRFDPVDGGVSAAGASRLPEEAFAALAATGLGEPATPIRPA
ncbi:MAG: hypothetical protein WB952_00960 [Terriglobales bacterium]